MRTLAIDCATEACSLALFDGERLLDYRHDLLGRGHAERLVPLIAGLPDKGRAGRILVSLGPGSFTGIRIGLATARALGVAWQAEVLGFPTLALVAAGVRQTEDALVCMTGGHGEWFVQPFDRDRLPLASARSMSPEDAVAAFPGQLVVGSRSEEFVKKRGFGTADPRLPDARDAATLAPALLTAYLRPIYGRAPDATPSP